MFSSTDYLKLQQFMEESPEKKELLSRLLTHHQITISSISHEIRNPLTLISSTMQLIESQHPEVLHFRYWSEMQQDVQYMNLLLNELSVYNNSERIHISLIDTNTFFRTLALSFATTLIDTEIQFISHIPSDLPPVHGDPVKLKEVFLNLLENAKDAIRAKYNDESNPSSDKTTYAPTIRLSASHESGFVKIAITDNGCGISSEHLTQIFEPFITHKKNGTGLGLAIASKIIHSHHGTIHVESIPGIHTTFTISLPVQQNS